MTQRNEEFDEMLDACYPVYKIGDMTFYASNILYECDPIAYGISVDEWEEWEEEEEEEEEEP